MSASDKPFYRSFTGQDWASYEGATKFADGSDPLIAELSDLRTVVIGGDPDGLKAIFAEIFFHDMDGNVKSYFRQFDTLDFAKGYIYAMDSMDMLYEQMIADNILDNVTDWMRGV